ncbi:ABC transporter mdrA2 [Capsaspora owczarzaki ATCC 30864]|uniref:ABC transporter mdrA2 n=1 Tax=Capsaspora owczarzaki (strain ATCC 30864) TaxID=595528 RepID=A0A0D2UGP9_CAPO3|nr:ABC transporter mdrA2 [Capsaspora owczarzaki ATCC 30864]KJE94261.1 ABC transporter mdrA2 [Capsaspora owczarzaki ATCC 30864]|eukprot:XP_004347681.2 ABC transporter mdrA2 [Capsaspora owczarzaki ATCC 30864]
MSEPQITFELPETHFGARGSADSTDGESREASRLASRAQSSAGLLAVQQERMDPSRTSHTDPQRVLYARDFRRAYYPPASMTSLDVVRDPHHEDFDMRHYYVEFVDKWFPGRPLGGFLEFRDISFRATVNKERHVHNVWSDFKQMVGINPRPETTEYAVLDGVSGYLEPGDMCIVLGGPSSGKTSLLKALSNRLSNAVRGIIQVNGQKVPDNFNRVIGLVPQQDIHIPTLTVKETLRFAAELQLPESMPSEDKNDHVDVVLKLLGLAHAADTMLGNNLIRGVSGGEKKRVTIGVELLKTPNLMLFDEPTTGLDSAAAFNVMNHVRGIADVGFPCMVALLQPSKELYDLFNKVLLISNGQIVYFGPKDDALPYFESIGISCPAGLNPAEFLAQVADHPEKFVAPSVSAELSTEHFHEQFRKSDIYAELGRKLWKGVAPRNAPPPANPNVVPKYSNSVWTQFKLNLDRAIKINLRDPAGLQVRISRSIMTGFIVGTLFVQLGSDQVGARNKLGVIINSVAFFAFGAAAMIPLYLDERSVYNSQRSAKYFQPFSYFAAVNLADIPFTILEVLLFSIILYFTVGLRSGAGYFFYWVFMNLAVALWSNSFCRAMTTIAPSFSIANAVIPAVIAIFLLFNGYLVPYGSFPEGWKWMYWISPLHYSYEGLAINEFEGNPLTCDPDQLVPPPFAPNFTAPFPYGFNGTQTCPFTMGDQYLATYSVQMGNDWIAWDMVIMYVFYLFFLLVTFVLQKYVTFDATHNPHVETTEDRANRRKILAAKMLNNVKKTTVSSETAKAYLEFKNLSYSVEVVDSNKKKVQKQLLKDINGYVKPGTMVALMGPSGAGKTTLLDVLADRKTGGTVTGEILVNGAPRNEFFKRISGYCEQQDIHFARSTVREAIAFSAMCRLPEEMSAEEKWRMVDNVIAELDMEDIAEDMVGTPAEGGLSAEQRKRLTIAVELVTDPPLLFLDEPTSGLDAYGAALVMNKIAEIARSGRSVICTIHQPSAELFLMFDHLLLLRPGGRQVFFGSVGQNLSLLLGYVKEHFGLTFKNDRNPADWMMDTVCTAPDKDGAALWDASAECKQVIDTLAKGVTPPDVKPPHFERARFATSLGTQLREVFPRTFQMFWRNPLLVKVRFMIYLVVGLILGSFLWQQQLDQAGATNRVAIMFFGIVFVAYATHSAIGDIMDMRTVFYREKMAGSYRVTAIAISIVLTEIPYHVIYVTFYVVPMYWISGLNPDAGRFFFFYLVFFTAYLCSLAFAQFIAVVSPNPAVANALAPTLTTFFFIFAGFLIPKESMGWYWRWFYYIDYFSYCISAFTVNEFSGLEFHCDEKSYVNVTSPYDPSQYKLYCPLTKGEDIFAIFNLDATSKWRDWGILLCFYAFFSALVFVGMRFYSALKR